MARRVIKPLPGLQETDMLILVHWPRAETDGAVHFPDAARPEVLAALLFGRPLISPEAGCAPGSREPRD